MAEHPPSASAEASYLQLLDAQRDRWPSEAQFQHWRHHYAAEIERGIYIRNTLEQHAGMDMAGARVADIGCGDCGVPVALARAGARVNALEPDPGSIERGAYRIRRHQVSVELCRGVAEDLPYAAARFDVVILDNVLEHVRDREATLAELRRVLRPAGLLYLVTPKPLALLSLWSDPHYGFAGLVLMPRALQRWYVESARGLGEGSYGVGHIPTRRWLRRALRRHGFTLVADPRQLWIDYLRSRLTTPAELRTPFKRRLGRLLKRHTWVFEAEPMRLLFDLALGSNYVIARRED